MISCVTHLIITTIPDYYYYALDCGIISIRVRPPLHFLNLAFVVPASSKLSKLPRTLFGMARVSQFPTD